MTVAALTPYVEYAENGVTLNFAAPFKYGAATNLEVRRQLADGSVSVLTYGAAWNATAGPTDAGGTVTLTSSIAGATLKIRRVTARSQQTDYVTNDNFPAETHEAALDRLTQIVQEQDVDLDLVTARALLVPEGESVPVLPNAAGRATKLLGFDSAGDPIMTPESADAQVLRAELTAVTGAALVGYSGKAELAGEQPSSVERKLRETVSIFDYMTQAEIISVLLFGFAIDVTAKIQLAIDDLKNGVIGGLYFPDGGYRLSASITAGLAAMYGWHVYGQSKANTVLRMFTNNTPHFTFTVNVMHSLNWHTMSLDWSAPQTGNANASGFKFLDGNPGATIGSIYNSSFTNMLITGAYYAIDSSAALFWGNNVVDVWSNNAVGPGGAKLNGASGQPNNYIDMKISISGAGVNAPAFHCAVQTVAWKLEVLGHPGPIVQDLAGGSHTFINLESESSVYAAGTVTLIDCGNSTVFVPGKIQLKGITMLAGATVRGFATSNAAGLLDGRMVSVSYSGAGITAQGAGSSFFLFTSGNSAMPGPMSLDAVSMPFSAPGASPVSALSDFSATATPDFCRVRSWVDPERVVRMDDADLTLAVDGPMNVAISKPHTAQRDILHPYDGAAGGNNLFGSWRRRYLVYPASVSAFATRLRNSANTVTLGTIPAGASGVYELRWDRAHLNPSTGSVGNWTFMYLGPIASDTGWAADTGTAKKTANATYVPGALLPFGAAYVEAEHDAAATRIQTVENALRDATQTIKSLKDALLANGTLSA